MRSMGKNKDAISAENINEHPFLSLKNRITFLTCIAVFLSTTLVGTLNYFQIEASVLKIGTEKLQRETTLMAQRFQLTYNAMRSDIAVLSQTPPIAGIMRATSGGGTDPVDGQTLSGWKQRLQTVFVSLLSARPHYIQVRYIGIAGNGREIVRVSQGTPVPVAVPETELQQIRQATYFQNGLSTARGQVHFSEVTYNSTNGKVDPTRAPTVHAVLPVFDQDNHVFGMIVVDADYNSMLRSAFEEIRPRNNTFVVTSAGDYVEYAKGTVYPLEFHTSYTRVPRSLVQKVVRSTQNEEIFTSETAVSSFVRLQVDPSNPSSFLGVVQRIPYDELLAPAYEARTVSMISGAAIVAACVLAALLVARIFIAPLQHVADELRKSGHGLVEADLPVGRRDEIGDLARAFVQRTHQLADAEAKANAVIDNIIDGIVTIDDRGRIDGFNPASERIFGYSAEEVIGKNVSILMPEPHHSAHNSYLENYRKTGKRSIIGSTRELEGRRKDGSIIAIELAVAELHLADKRMFSGIIRDISERKLVEVLKDEFVSTVNHELRTPLTSIQGALGLLINKTAQNVDEKSQRLLQLSYDNCQRLSRLVNDILDLEKIAAGKLEYNFDTVEICSLVRQVVESQNSYGEKHGVTFKLNLSSMRIPVRLDPDRFSQALVNLISNAAKFSKRGDEVEIGVAMANELEVKVWVRDHGPGIPETFRGKVFEKFAQADSSATRKIGGSGLGLNITKSIVEAFDGNIGFDSVEGEGTVFTIVLPTVVPKLLRA